VKLSDTELSSYVIGKLALPGEDRNEYREQVGRLLDKLGAVLPKTVVQDQEVPSRRLAGKGTSNRPRAGKPVDADVVSTSTPTRRASTSPTCRG